MNELFVKIGADFKELEKGLSNAQNKISNFGKATSKVGTSLTKNVTAPILAVGGGLLALGIKLGNTADRILDLNAITGMTTDAIQEWQFVTKEAGVSTEAVTNATQKLTKQMFALENDSGKASESFAKLGLNFEEFNQLSADDRISTLIDRLSTIEDETERARIGTELLGGAWQDIAPIVALGSDAIANARQEARDMGAVMDGEALESANNFRIQMEKLKTQFQVAGNEIGLKFLPILTDTLIPILQNNIIPLIDKVVQVIKIWVDRFMELDDKTKNIILAVIGIASAIGPLLVVGGKLIGVFAFLISPIGLITVAIVALIAAGVLLYANWEEVSDFLSKKWEALKNLALHVWGMIKDFFIETFESIKEVAIEVWTNISNFFTETFESIKTKTLELWESIEKYVILIGGIITGLFIPKLVMLGISATVNAAKVVAAWVVMSVQATTSAIITTATAIPSIIAGFIRMSIASTINALKVVGAWVMTSIAAVANVAIMVAQSAVMVAKWVMMGTQSLIQAARMAAAWIIAMGPIAWITSAIIGFSLLIIMNWEKIKEMTIKIYTAISNKIKEIWNSIIEKIKEIITNIVVFMTEKFNEAKEKISEILEKIKTGFSNVWNGITSIVKGAVNLIIGYINLVISAYEKMINLAGKAVNSIPSINVPDWVPLIGGKSFSLPKIPTISLPKIPKLAEGGIITRPTLAMIGEGGESEAVIPLSKLDGLGGGREVHIYLDGREITRSVAPQMVDMIRAKGIMA